MRAIVLREFGPPEQLVLEDVPDLQLRPGELLIEVELSNVTFVETQIRAGWPPHPSMAPQLPVVPGNGVGGTVTAVGSGADASLLGRRVVSSLAGTGGYAERVAVDAGMPIELPDGLAMTDAVALLSDGRTALGLIDAAGLQPGETVLVEAAAGGVGSLLVQLATAAGAHVVAAAGGARKTTLARELGADIAVDYTQPDWGELVGEVDVVFDGIGGAIAGEAYELVRPGGRFSAFGMASGAFVSVEGRHDVTMVRGARPSAQRSRQLSERALTEAAAGRLRPLIGQTFELRRAADAHAAIESRATVGKTLLVP